MLGRASVIYVLVKEVDNQSGGGGGITAENGQVPRLIHSEDVRHMCRRSSLKACAVFWIHWRNCSLRREVCVAQKKKGSKATCKIRSLGRY
jgi:hypothetical protein